MVNSRRNFAANLGNGQSLFIWRRAGETALLTAFDLPDQDA